MIAPTDETRKSISHQHSLRWLRRFSKLYLFNLNCRYHLQTAPAFNISPDKIYKRSRFRSFYCSFTPTTRFVIVISRAQSADTGKNANSMLTGANKSSTLSSLCGIARRVTRDRWTRIIVKCLPLRCRSCHLTIILRCIILHLISLILSNTPSIPYFQN